MRRRGDIARDDVLIEFYRVGNAVRVVAIDQRSGTEVVIVGPATAGAEQLSRTAADKLRYVLNSRDRDMRRRSGLEV